MYLLELDGRGDVVDRVLQVMRFETRQEQPFEVVSLDERVDCISVGCHLGNDDLSIFVLELMRLGHWNTSILDSILN